MSVWPLVWELDDDSLSSHESLNNTELITTNFEENYFDKNSRDDFNSVPLSIPSVSLPVEQTFPAQSDQVSLIDNDSIHQDQLNEQLIQQSISMINESPTDELNTISLSSNLNQLNEPASNPFVLSQDTDFLHGDNEMKHSTTDETFEAEQDSRLASSLFNGLFNGNPQVQETKYRKRITSNEFFLRLQEYAFFANEAYCGTYGDMAFSDKIRGFVLVLESKKQIYFSFRSAKQLLTLKDWPFNDNKLVSTKGSMPKGLMIHGGIYQNYLTAQAEILKIAQDILQRPEHHGFEVILIGDGLGGAYATLAALDIQKKFPELQKIQVYTFGQPRIGNAVFANYVDSFNHTLQINRITNYKDSVPSFPPNSQGYIHTGGEIWISKLPNWIFDCPGIDGGENHECVNTPRDLQKDHSQHTGPYFGITMGKCRFESEIAVDKKQ
ncbi:hypothetical protein G9A89_005994 [Geosiphon pyriformis]|nr:hypothetical protein G9A89_005994 [Geosiphon pyriformis]